MRHATRRTILAGFLGCMLSACATASEVRRDPFAGDPVGDEVLLTVHNYERRAATVYAYWNGMKERVGTIMASKTETFRMRWRNEEVQLGYELLGRRAVGGSPDREDAWTSRPMEVTQGDHLDFIIQGR